MPPDFAIAAKVRFGEAAPWRERIRRRTYHTRDDARRDIFEYIELFYNPKRKHTNNGLLSPVDFETRQLKLNQAGV